MGQFLDQMNLQNCWTLNQTSQTVIFQMFKMTLGQLYWGGRREHQDLPFKIPEIQNPVNTANLWQFQKFCQLE